MNSEQLQMLLVKLSEGTLLPEEEAQLHRIVEQLSSAEREEPLLLEDWKQAAAVPATAEELAASQLALQALKTKLQAEQAPVVPLPSRRRTSRWMQAACLAGAIAVMAVLYIQRNPFRNHVPILAATTWKEVNTRRGEHRQLTLADGTVIYLNGNSTLKYPTTFEDSLRQVQLVSGEIFVEAGRNAAKPFIVITSRLRVRVLGTSFNVRNKRDEQEVQVAVKTGKVAFEQLMLLPGHQGIFNRQDSVFRETILPPYTVGSWVRGEHFFEEATLREILASLEDNYGFRYRIKKAALLDRQFKASFRGHSPEEMIQMLSVMGDFRYAIKDSIITIQ